MILFRKFRYNAIILLSLMFVLLLAGCAQTDILSLEPGVHVSRIIQNYESLDTLLNTELTFSGKDLESRVFVKSLDIELLNRNDLLFKASVEIKDLCLDPGHEVKYSLSKTNLKELIHDSDEGLSDAVNKISLKFNFDTTYDMSTICDLYIARPPVIFMSAGQDIGHRNMVKMLCDKLYIPYDWSNKPTVEHLNGGTGFQGYLTAEKAYTLGPRSLLFESNSDIHPGTSYNTVVLMISQSKYGMDWAGLNMAEELKRIKDMISWAEDNNLAIIGMHYENHEVEILAPVDVEIIPAEEEHSALTRKVSPGYKKIPNLPSKEEELLIDYIFPHCDLFIAMDNDTYTDKVKELSKKHQVEVEFADISSQITPTFRTTNLRPQSQIMRAPELPPGPSNIKNIYPYSKAILPLFKSIFNQ